MAKRIFFITSHFPYYPGEEFIETEIKHLGVDSDVHITIFPLRATGHPRLIPKSVEVDLHLARGGTAWRKAKSFFRMCFKRFFWIEVFALARVKVHKTNNFLRVIKQGIEIVLIRDLLYDRVRNSSEGIVIYCYWNASASYGCVLLKESACSWMSVISRAHGGDLYEERNRYSYFPYKRQFVNGLDAILPISSDGARYLIRKYGVDADRITTVPLGVDIPATKCSPTKVGMLSILSVSFLVEIKRIDKIIDSLRYLAGQQTIEAIKWHHIGGGPLLEHLQAYAEKQLSACGIDWAFLGTMKNSEVKSYYANNCIDIFLNASESEGVPVSIMEAMSFGVPVVAPDVGGVREIVSDEWGKLLSSSPDKIEIANAINGMFEVSKNEIFREGARQKVSRSFNEKANYDKLLDVLKAV